MIVLACAARTGWFAADATQPLMTRTLLVVDDNSSVRESLRFFLERRGFGVVLASSGPEAIAMYGQHVIDGAMIDVQMPGMNGIDVCRVLREQAGAANRPFVVWMMTGGRSPELAKFAVEAGAVALLGKPFDYADLYQRFETSWPDIAAGETAAASGTPTTSDVPPAGGG